MILNMCFDLYAEYFDLQLNEFSSTISPKIGQWTNLKHFAVGDNRLTGPLPIDALQKLTKLHLFVISANRLEGRPFDAATSWLQLVEFGLYDMPFIEGSIPTSIGKLSMLVHLFIDNLDSVIPTEIGLLTNLVTFHFTTPGTAIEGLDSNMTATLPTEMGLLTDLKSIIIQSNDEIRGTIPTGKRQKSTRISDS